MLGFLALTGCATNTPAESPKPPESLITPSAPHTETTYDRAQNVYKPIEPDGINAESAEGLEKFIIYWNQMRTYAIQTGDTAPLKQITSNEYDAEITFIDSIERLYASGGWINGLEREFHLDPSQLNSYGEGLYGWKVNCSFSKGVVSQGSNTQIIDNTDAQNHTYEFLFTYENGSWKAVNGAVSQSTPKPER